MSRRSNRPVDWERLVAQNETRLYRAALAILGDAQEAQDAVQDTFVAYLEKAPEGLDSEGAWLLRVLVNRCKSRLRLARRREVPLTDTMPAPEPEERETLEAVMALPPEERAAVHLFYYEGYSTDEISRITGSPAGTVRSRLSRAREKLRALLTREETGRF